MQNNTEGTQNNYDNNIIVKTLNLLSKHWEKRAKVKDGKSTEEYNFYFNYDDPDFKESLLPFCGHPLWEKSPNHIKSLVLSWGWVLYNQKTIHIEVEIINPVLEDIVLGRIPGANNASIKKVIAQTYVDESYHTLLSLNACDIVSFERNLGEIHLPKYELVKSQDIFIEDLRNKAEEKLVKLATASVSEIMISSYLEKLSNDHSIQKLCWMTVDAHRRDELTHATIFSLTMKEIFSHLNKEEQNCYLRILPLAIKWFASKELDVWEAVLQHIKFPDYQKMLQDVRATGQSCVNNINYSGVVKLAEDLDKDVSDYFSHHSLAVTN